MEAVRQRYRGRPLVAIFEPRSYTAQRREFQEPYRDALSGAERVVLAGLFHPERYTAETGLDPERLIEGLRASGVAADYIPDVDEIVARVVPDLAGNEVILVMSNGGFGGIHAKLLDALGQGVRE
jgi:UDP-N-acetylmuramate: L-alanyl-gamma-D-glutamyl-meso-diaminopimelate ligase